MTERPDLTRDWLEARVAELIEDAEGPLDADENLIFYGLDSIRVMKLAAELKAKGVEMSFDELAQTPTLNAWWARIEARRQAA